MGNLSAKDVEGAKPAQRRFKLYDGDGLYLLVGASSKTWYVKFMKDGATQNIRLGDYPSISLKLARIEALKQRNIREEKLEEGVVTFEDFRTEKKKKSEISFSDFYKTFYLKKSKTCTPAFMLSMNNRFEKHIIPSLGSMKIDEIEFRHIRLLLEKIEKQGIAETGKKIRGYLVQLFREAKIKEYITPEKCNTLIDLKGILTAPIVTNHPAIINEVEFGKLIKNIKSDTRRSVAVKYALEILSNVFLRANELSKAKWEEIDFEKDLWTIPSERMKGTIGKRTELVVPLSKQVKNLLLSLKSLNLSETWIFPQSTHGIIKDNPISNESLNNGLIALGYKDKQSAHGFRASFRTIGAEVLKFDFEPMELQLHHALTNIPNGQAYGRHGRLEERREMMQKWSDYLDTISE